MDDNRRPQAKEMSKAKAPARKIAAEARLAAAFSAKEPLSKEKATEALLVLATAGRIRPPSSGRGS